MSNFIDLCSEDATQQLLEAEELPKEPAAETCEIEKWDRGAASACCEASARQRELVEDLPALGIECRQPDRFRAQELHRRILALCQQLLPQPAPQRVMLKRAVPRPGNTKFLGIGSGLQRKFGEAPGFQVYTS